MTTQNTAMLNEAAAMGVGVGVQAAEVVTGIESAEGVMMMGIESAEAVGENLQLKLEN